MQRQRRIRFLFVCGFSIGHLLIRQGVTSFQLTTNGQFSSESLAISTTTYPCSNNIPLASYFPPTTASPQSEAIKQPHNPFTMKTTAALAGGLAGTLTIASMHEALRR